MFIYTFMMAYLSPYYSTVVKINRFNEAHIEFIMILIFIPICIYTGLHLLKELK